MLTDTGLAFTAVTAWIGTGFASSNRTDFGLGTATTVIGAFIDAYIVP